MSMSKNQLKSLEGFARNRGIYILFCEKEWKLYSSNSGYVLATVYPDNWRVLAHFGAQGKHTAASAFAAVHLVCDLLALEKAKGKT